MDATSRRWVLLTLFALAVVACGSRSPARPSAPLSSPSPSIPASFGTTASPGPTIEPTPAPPSRPSVTPAATATSSPVPALDAAERRVLDRLRFDARVDCVPRRTDRPPGSDVGVECRPHVPLVARVGIYGFRTDGGTAAIDAYTARLQANGVTLGSGDCAAGTPGDASWPANLPDGDRDGPSELRSGCYRDASGSANVRVTCYGDIYIGVLGAGRDIAPLYAWTWRVAAGESVHRDPPGICAAPD